ncbi:hypothetical protein OIU85_025765 [Salix viminalis]|uniref:Uncharacterized protein n=1 Tax=Salix viminalis TaxID=40686 RepID=A0A9Q0TM13_SALVM|nr:hypothetical protein OIU85_025765 [Salix viminalis]
MIEGFKFRSMLLNWSVMKWAKVFRSLIDDQENILFMRVLFCKIRCPFICFCKPSPRIYGPGPGPLKLENSPHVPSTAVISVVAADASYDDDHVLNDSVEVKEGNAGVYGEEPQAQNGLKSSLKKAGFDSKEVDKKKVRWIDSLGKELVEIREFESRFVISVFVYYSLPE